MKEQNEKVSIRDVYEIVARLEGKLDIKIDELEKKIDTLDEKFVTRVEFWPVKTIVYSGAGIVLTAVFSAIVYLVVKK